MRTEVILIVAMGLSLSSVAVAQPDSAVGVTFEFAPMTSLQGDADLARPPELGYGNVRANAIFPVELENWDAVLLPGFTYRLYRVRTGDNAPPDGPDRFHDLGLTMGLLKRLGSEWSVLASVSAGVATDFEDVEADHFRYQALGVVRHEYGEAWTFGAGAAWSYWFGEQLLLPALQVVYRGDRWNANLILPRIANVRYTVLDGFDVGLIAQVDGNRFSIGQDLPVESVNFSIADAGLRAGVRIRGPIWLTVFGGFTLFRRFDFLTEDNTELLELDQEQGPIFRVGVVLRPNRK